MRRFLICLALLGLTFIGIWSALALGSQPPDLSGLWRFDPSKSDAPPSWSGGGGPHGGGGYGGGGGWGGHHGGYHGGGGDRGGAEGGEGGGSARRPPRLPDLLKIEQQPEYVVLEDSTGADVMQIVIGEGKVSSNPASGSTPRIQGEWKKDVLEAKHEDDRGFKVTQTYALKDQGRSLEVTTKVEGRRSFQTKRVYQREHRPS